MLLYDVFYGNAVDSAMPFPSSPDARISRIVCVNGERTVWTVRRMVTDEAQQEFVAAAAAADLPPVGGSEVDYDFSFERATAIRRYPRYGAADKVYRTQMAHWLSIDKPDLSTLEFVKIT